MAQTVVIDITARFTDETSRGLGKAKQSSDKLGDSLRRTQQQADKLGKSKSELNLKDKATQVIEKVNKSLKSITSKAWNLTVKILDKATAPIRGIFNLLKNPIVQAGAVLGVSIGVKDTIDTYANFEATMSKVQAISSATVEEMTAINMKAKEIGADTKFTAAQAGEAFTYMAMAGWKSKEMLGGIDGIINLAASSGENLGTVSDIVTDAMTAFGLAADGTTTILKNGLEKEVANTTHFADVLAAASSNSNTNVAMLGESFKYAGALAGQFKFSIEDTALALGLMANSGIKASNSGTALRKIFAQFSSDFEINQANGSTITVKTTTAEGKMKSLKDIIDDTRAAFNGMSKDEKNVLENDLSNTAKGLGINLTSDEGKLKTQAELYDEVTKHVNGLTDAGRVAEAEALAGKTAMAGLLSILGASEKDYQKLADAVYNADGTAAKMAAIMMDNLQGDMILFQSAADGVKIAFMEKLNPYLRSFVKWITSNMPDVSMLMENAADKIGKGIDNLKSKIQDFTSTSEWKDADFFGKVSIAWDKIVAEPFGQWWNSTGKQWFADKANGIGEGIGKGISNGLLVLLGFDIQSVAEDGINIGTSFAEGFSKGFDGQKVAEALNKTLKTAVKMIFSNPVTGGLATAWIGSKVLGGVSKAYSLGSTVANGGGLFGGVLQGFQIAKTAKTGGHAAESALTFARAGQLGLGAKIGSAGLGGIALGTAGIAGGIAGGVTLISGVKDFYKAMKSNNEKESATYKESATWKVGGVATGALIGTMIAPGIGTAIGAGIGGIAGWIMGDSAKKRYEEAMEQEKKAEAAALLAKEQAKYSSQELKDALADTSISAEEFNKMFQKNVVQGLQSSFGDITLTLTEIQSIAKKLTFGKASESLNAFSSATADVNTDLSNLQNTVISLRKINWKANLGFEWTESDNSEFITVAQNMISESKKLLQSKNYEASMAVNLILGDSNSNGIVNGLNNIYTDLQSEVNNLSEKANVILKSNGILNLDKQTEVNNLLGQIKEITDMVSESQAETELDFLNIKYGGSEMDFASFEKLQQELPQYLESAKVNFDEAFKTSLANIKLEAKFNPDFDYATAEKEITDKYMENINAIEKRVVDFQMDSIAKALENQGVADQILSDFEGPLSERLQTALLSALTISDKSKWDSNTWVELLGLEDNTELAGQLETVLNPVVQNMSKGFLDSFGISSAEATESAFKIFEDDLKTKFAREINAGATVTVKTEVKTQYIKDKLEGNNASFGSLNNGYTIIRPATPNSQPLFPNTEFKPMPTYANGGIMTKPHVGLIGEAGPEVIIPLSGANKEHGINLWQQTGELLGLIPKHAKGGIFGNASNLKSESNNRNIIYTMLDDLRNNSESKDNESKNTVQNNPITISLGGINFTFNGTGTMDKDSIMQIIKEQMPEIADDVAQAIADKLKKLFPNMKAGII